MTDNQLDKLTAPLIKKGASVSAIIKVLRQSGYSFSGKRVRVLVAAKPTPKAKAAAKSKAAKPAKVKNAAQVTPEEAAALGINR